MGEILRVMLVDNEAARAGVVRAVLERLGCRVVKQVASTLDLAKLVAKHTPDVIIIDTESPSRDTLEHLCMVSRDQPRPVVMFTHDDDSEKIRAAIRAGVSAYIVDRPDAGRLKSVIDAAIASFEEYHALRAELGDAHAKLADRKVIERAKGLLMKQRGQSEEEAFQSLRKLAMDRHIKLADMARQLISAAELLG